MVITKLTRQTAIVNHLAEYNIDDQYWDSLIESGLSEDEALDEARSQGNAKSIAYSTKLVEPVMEHETSIETNR